jgi:hypothetical protein
MVPARCEGGVVAVVYAALVAIGVMVAWAALRRPREHDDERGAAEASFMKKVVKVSLLVMLVTGGTVWLLDRADEGPPDSGSGERTPQHPAQQPDGGTKNR